MLSSSVTVREHQPIIPELITDSQSFESVDIFVGEIGNSSNRSQAQKDSAITQLNEFLND